MLGINLHNILNFFKIRYILLSDLIDTIMKNKHSFLAMMAGFILLSIIISGLTTVAVLNLKSDIIMKELIKANNSQFVTERNQSVIRETSYLEENEDAVLAAVKKVKPAVVSIIINKEVSEIGSNNDLFGDDSPFSFKFFGFGDLTPIPTPPKNNRVVPKEKEKIGGGTGFFISSDGLLLTNKHVVEDTEAEYVVATDDGTEYNATVKAIDPFFDLAILKVEGSGFPVIDLGDSNKLEVGQTVLAVGNALAEYGGTVTKGILSAKERSAVVGSQNSGEVERLDGVLQTDASINPGNSGGPLVNLLGEAIGINTAIASSAEGIGFAIPINDVKTAVSSFNEKGKIIRPQLGLRYRLITKSLADKNQLPVEEGALVVRGDNPDDLAVIPGGPADKAGITENDIILEVNGEKVNETNSLSRLIQKNAVDVKVILKILHDGEEKEVTVILTEASQSTQPVLVMPEEAPSQ